MPQRFIFLMLITLGLGCASTIPNHLKYIDANKPLLTPQIFAPDFISTKEEYQFGSVFSKDGKEFYYAVDGNGKAEIRFTQLKNQVWSKPITIVEHSEYSYNDPFLSPDEQELFYISNQPLNELDTIKDHDIWYSKRRGNGWSSPINAGDKINTGKEEYYISFTKNGKMYFSSNKNAAKGRNHNFDIYASERIEGIFQEPVLLNDSINTGRYEADVFIAPDESYIIYCSAKREGFGNGDLYINFKDKNGQWGTSKNMGEMINSESNELCPFVTLDGKYFFYTSKKNIYWVSTKLFDNYR